MKSADAYLAVFDRLVVVAPHPDDDVLGCGGTIAAATARGLGAAVLYVTDGSASHAGSAAYPPRRLRSVREEEARNALAVLGVRSAPRFLGVADGTVAALDATGRESVVTAVADAAADEGRVLVLGPWARDHHADHVAVAALVRAACARRPHATLLEYAVWLDELGTQQDRPGREDGRTVRLDVARHVALKTAALAHHASQLGLLITDATTAFALPPGLIAGVQRPYERFVRVAGFPRR